MAEIARMSLASEKSADTPQYINNNNVTLEAVLAGCQTQESVRQFVQILEWNLQREIQATQYRFHKRRVPLYTALSEK